MLSPALLSTIGDLELVSRVIVEGTISGLHRSPFHGYSAEFSQYRHYRPGDDLKYVDWKLFARTDRLYTKQFRETTNLACAIAVDVSASMAYAGVDGVSKLAYARMASGAIAYLLARQGDAIGLALYREKIARYLPPQTGQSHLHNLLLTLAGATAEGSTNAAVSLGRVVDLMRRRGLLIVISDLYDEGEAVESVLRRAVHVGHDVVVLHVLTPDEVSPTWSADVELVDLESNAAVVTGSAARAEYVARMAAFLERWRVRCASQRIDYRRLTTDMPLDRALRDWIRRRAAGSAA